MMARSVSPYERGSTTCIVADDHPAILDCISRWLAAAGFDVVAVARDGDEALALTMSLRPVVCIADVRMPKLDGLDLARELANGDAGTAVLLYSGVAESGLASEALHRGARGFASKDAPLQDLGRAIDLVAAGGIYIDPVLAAALASRGRADAKTTLTESEREVLRMLADGSRYEEIGSRLFLAPATVRVHAQHAMRKLGARTRTEAVAVALRTGLMA